MDTPKPKRKSKRKTVAFKDNVSYLADVTNDKKFSSPVALLQSFIDDFRAARCTAEKIFVVALHDDGETFTYSEYGYSAKDLHFISGVLSKISLKGFGELPDDDE